MESLDKNKIREFCESVQKVCENPKQYTKSGTFYEVGLFLSLQALEIELFPYRSHHGLYPFHKWLAKNFDFRRNVDFVPWSAILEKYENEKIALEKLAELYHRFTSELLNE